MCPEIAISRRIVLSGVDFIHKSVPEQYLDAYIGCHEVLDINKNIPTKHHLM